jgi:hypothetical protein
MMKVAIETHDVTKVFKSKVRSLGLEVPSLSA